MPPIADSGSDASGDVVDVDSQYGAPRSDPAGPAQWGSPLRVLYWAILMRVVLVLLGAIGAVVAGYMLRSRQVPVASVAGVVTTITVGVEIVYLLLWLPVLFAISRYRKLPPTLQNGTALGVAFVLTCVQLAINLFSSVGLLGDLADPIMGFLLGMPTWFLAFALATAFAETASTLRWEPITRSTWRLRWYLLSTALLSLLVAVLKGSPGAGLALVSLALIVMALLSLARFAREASDLASALDLAQRQAERS